MEKLLRILKHDFFVNKINGAFINPKYYKIPRRDFHKVRAAVEKMGLRAAQWTATIGISLRKMPTTLPVGFNTREQTFKIITSL